MSIPHWSESISRFFRYNFWLENFGQKVYLKGRESGRGELRSKKCVNLENESKQKKQKSMMIVIPHSCWIPNLFEDTLSINEIFFYTSR